MKDDLEVLREELERAVGGLDGHQTQLRPLGTHDKWSIQQVVVHLLQTYAATEKAMDIRLAKGEPTKARPSLAQRLGQFILLQAGYFPRGRIAPEEVCPLADQEAAPAGILLAQLGSSLSAMNKKMAACEAMFGSGSRAVNHRVLGPLNGEQWARFHLAHGRHHIKQIVAIRRQHRV